LRARKLIWAAAISVLSLTAAAGAGAPAASAATPSCGTNCINWFSEYFGTTPGFVVDVFRQGLKVGQPLILFRSSNSDPAQDFTVSFDGFVSDFYQAGLVSAAVNFHYGCNFNVSEDQCGNAFADDPAVEMEYAPYGVDSGLCWGLASTAAANEGVTLQPCGLTSRTAWILDIGLHPDAQQISGDEDPLAFANGFFPLINGSDTNFSHPFVLTYPKTGYPTDKPRPQLKVTNLTGFSNGLGQIVGSVPDYQLWSFTTGVLQP
jgi:hypothetical protein